MSEADFLKTWRIGNNPAPGFNKDGLITLYKQKIPKKGEPICCLVSDATNTDRAEYCTNAGDRKNWEDATFRYNSAKNRLVAVSGVQGYFDFPKGSVTNIHWHAITRNPSPTGPGASWNGTED